MSLAQVTLGAGKSDPVDILATLAIVTLFIALMYTIGAWNRQRTARRTLQAQLQGQRQQTSLEQQQFERRRSEQQDQFNALALKKLGIELQLMEMELNARQQNESRRDAMDEMNQTGLEKLRLEIQSLKLHIKEQRSRVDDYGQHEDE